MAQLLYGTEEDLLEIEGKISTRSAEENEALLNAYSATLEGVEEGKIVAGTILEYDDTNVIVDISFKSEGVIPRGEFKNPEELQIGAHVDVYIEQIEGDDGQIVLSKQRADFMKVWERIRDAYETGEVVEGTLLRRIKGGIVVDLFGIEAFLPGSQIDLRQIPDMDALIGQTMGFRVIKVHKSRRNIVVSRRIVLEEERGRLRDQIIDTLERGQVRDGVVKNITDFGAFIDLGGVDGLLHITDMTWGRISHPSELVHIGQKLTVKVLDFNDRKERISLGLKQLQEHPWKTVATKYPEGARVNGKIVSITDYGAFMELEQGVEGLIHISEMSWTQHVKHPSQVVKVGDMVEAVVLRIDTENEKISLGIKQIEPDPWSTIEADLPLNSVVTGQVRNLAPFGAFVEIKEGIDGLIHVSDMSWTKKVNHPSEVLQKGDTVTCMVLSVDKEKRRISLSLKAMGEDPWKVVPNKYPLGKQVEAPIVRLLDRGVVLELEEGIEGFVPLSKLTEEPIKVPAEAFRVGQTVKVTVVEHDVESRKLTLSAIDTSTDWRSYVQGSRADDSRTTLGDIFRAAQQAQQQ
ncbi:MAG: 30S ribosomal protein S1 [Fibrobacteres bacterium]|nr:30S ribosomal protein S1 [Fibrobacterota bacterium]